MLQGDSGGPLLCPFDRHKDRWFVGGIVSWGIKCAHPHLPGVYANVPKYVSWIKEQMEKHSDWEDVNRKKNMMKSRNPKKKSYRIFPVVSKNPENIILQSPNLEKNEFRSFAVNNKKTLTNSTTTDLLNSVQIPSKK